MTDRFAGPHFTTVPSDKAIFNSVWCFRVVSFLALLSLVLAQTKYRNGDLHDFLLGLPTGLLIGLLATSFYARKVSFR